MKRFLHVLLMMIALSGYTVVYGQYEAYTIEAEDADTIGSDFTQGTDGAVTYLTPSTDFISPPDKPNVKAKMITFNLTFPHAGVYDLYVKVRVGSAAANDDSFVTANTFGLKDSANAADWIIVNNIGNVGASAESQYVTSTGAAGTLVWKWINVSEYLNSATPVTFTVPEGELTQVYQYGSRENGLDLDKIAFGVSHFYYTVADLDSSEAGDSTLPNVNQTDPIATGKSKWLGCAYSSSQKSKFNWYWNQVTPENEGKWGFVEATRDVFTFGGLDEAYNFAKTNNFPFKLHILLWGRQQPVWLKDLSAEEQLEEIDEWFDTLSKRYPDLKYLEVVNEPINDPPLGTFASNVGTTDYGGYYDALGGAGASGWDWVINSFKKARQYFPNAKLMLNEYNILNGGDITSYINIINILKTSGAGGTSLIDHIGVQGHAFTVNNLSATTITTSLNQLSATGLPIYVTELDIDGPDPNGDAVQLQRYQTVFPALWTHPAVKGITMWGYRPGLWRPDAALIDADGVTERPAIEWLRTYVESTVLTDVSEPISSNNNTISIYPNPVRDGYLNINGLNEVTEIRIYDMFGRILYQNKNISSEQLTLETVYSPGMYIVECISGSNTLTQTIVIE